MRAPTGLVWGSKSLPLCLELRGIHTGPAGTGLALKVDPDGAAARGFALFLSFLVSQVGNCTPPTSLGFLCRLTVLIKVIGLGPHNK